MAETLLEYLNAVNDADHIRAEFSPEGTEFGVGLKVSRTRRIVLIRPTSNSRHSDVYSVLESYATCRLLYFLANLARTGTGLPPISRTHHLSTLQIFKLYRADIADGRMPAFWVVKPFDVIEDIGA